MSAGKKESCLAHRIFGISRGCERQSKFTDKVGTYFFKLIIPLVWMFSGKGKRLIPWPQFF